MHMNKHMHHLALPKWSSIHESETNNYEVRYEQIFDYI